MTFYSLNIPYSVISVKNSNQAKRKKNHKKFQANSELTNLPQLPKCVYLFTTWLLYVGLIYIKL